MTKQNKFFTELPEVLSIAEWKQCWWKIVQEVVYNQREFTLKKNNVEFALISPIGPVRDAESVKTSQITSAYLKNHMAEVSDLVMMKGQIFIVTKVGKPIYQIAPKFVGGKLNLLWSL